MAVHSFSIATRAGSNPAVCSSLLVRLQGDGWAVNASWFPFPPSCRAIAPSREAVVEAKSAHVFGRCIREWILLEEVQHVRRALKEAHQKIHKPRVLPHVAQR